MFANAIKIMSEFTHPVISSQRFLDGTISCGCATFIILNDEGWILTSAHVLNAFKQAQQHEDEHREYDKKKEEILINVRMNEKQKRKAIKKLGVNQKWIVNHSFWWGKDNLRINTFHLNDFIDLAVGKLENFDARSVSVYPTFKNPTNELPVGASLCKLGFPFHKVDASFNEQTGGFQLAPGVLPMPRFPMEGMYTRTAIARTPDLKEAKFLETSTPGLRGQSGGPIFDVYGNIWALQSRTQHFPLGFSPKLKQNNKEIEEHQFLNVGLGTHVEEIVKFLSEFDIKFNLENNS